ncbi:MAG: 2-phosphosulfolactate phosphatase [Odoribacter sp.]|nr:2-phosphosulfolactate phosphatase [Odoribacter sp.]
MKIEFYEFVSGAKQAHGVVVIIDVFRAFSVACYAFDSGASQYIATDDVKSAFDLRKKYTNSVLIGERDEKKIEGFDFGNSPTEILKANLEGVTVIHTTTAGTNGLVNAENASVLLTGSFVNAGAIVKYIRSLNPEHVSLVAMGYRALHTADEDTLCGRLISERLSGYDPDIRQQLSDLKTGSGSRFFNPLNIEFSPPTDFFLCTMIDRFNFVLRAERRFDGHISLIKTDV